MTTDNLKPYRLFVSTGPLAGKNIVVRAGSEWDAMNDIQYAGISTGINDWPVFHAPGTGDLFGDAVDVPTITLEQALEALNADGRTA